MQPKALLLIPLLLAAAPPSFADPSAATKADEAEIKRIEDRMCGMVNMSQRVEDTIDFYAKDAVQFDVMPDALVGQDAIRKSLAVQYGNVRNMTCRMDRLTIGVEGSLGYAYSIQHYEAEGINGGPYENANLYDDKSKTQAAVKVVMSWRQTDIYRKRDGKWAMIHQHSSFPMQLSTGKAVMQFDGYPKAP